MGGPAFSWDAPFGNKLWVAEFRISNADADDLLSPRLRLRVHGGFTAEHHFGIQVWDQPRHVPTISPIDVFTTMQSVSSLFQAHVRTSQVRYQR